MNINALKQLYFLGIGGIGMSALARYFKMQGVEIHGYDRTPSALTLELENEGMAIHYHEDIGLIPALTELVVYTPAIPQSNKEFVYLREKGVPMLKRAQVLGKLTEGRFTIAVAGTHGKTSITSTIAHLLHSMGIAQTALIGGICKNFNSNMVAGIGENPVMLVEADEFDKSFLQLHPDIAVISSMDADHLDIYHDHRQMQETFQAFAKQLKPDGLLIKRHGLPVNANKQMTYGLTENAEVRGYNIMIEHGQFRFDLNTQLATIKNTVIGVPGRHNIENALAAIAVVQALGKNVGLAAQHLASYSGVKRRFDMRVNRPDYVFIDDYAHHPEEIRACINAAREMYPGKRITGIFQPHLYSRTRDLLVGFAESLALLDQLVLLDIYPAREEPISGIDSALLLKSTNMENKHLIQKTEVTNWLALNRPEVLLTIGAGDIDRLVEPIEKMIKSW
jgi:UDP-N-acetylmuramate--alanine ligase